MSGVIGFVIPALILLPRFRHLQKREIISIISFSTVIGFWAGISLEIYKVFAIKAERDLEIKYSTLKSIYYHGILAVLMITSGGGVLTVLFFLMYGF